MYFPAKKSIATIVFTLLAFTSYAQQSKFSFSINSLTTNFNYGSANKGLQPYKKNFKGLQIGTAYQIGLTPNFSLAPEANFAIKGGILGAGNPVSAGKTSVRLYTIDVPVFARLHLGQFYLNAGPYAGYTLGGLIKIDGSADVAPSKSKISFGRGASDFKRWDYGLQAGAGYNFQLEKSVLTLDARYGYGLANMSVDIARYNRMLNISLIMSKRK
ncbi:Outer membrane protein beta-barrel domain-containing protein [Dyadobacter soli]|uniref:Outer membrane protein beta-barrel domain-containing protein n=1 Tax=Dyadobacter soli TaxID=659014 RepID=A0A1G7M9U5_9BACT|nr:porin family protein [Dyadobacter soli]SDF58507.1 Outer membrane protein beta-barrel domain-containing protein [Dyadobacter soli]